ARKCPADGIHYLTTHRFTLATKQGRFLRETRSPHCWLLRARRERRRSHRSAEQRDELAASRSITSSARAQLNCGGLPPVASGLAFFPAYIARELLCRDP